MSEPNQNVNEIEDDVEKHWERHKLLHAHLDELFADYIEHHPDQHGFLDMPLVNLIEWSHKQTINPTKRPNR